MEKERLLERIDVNPKVMVGKPVIKGTRLTVHYILSLLASGMTVDEILSEYDGLEREDTLACLAFAAEALERTEFVPLVVEANARSFCLGICLGNS
ncbi:DUF433 domain-containing protein [Thermocrinis sp.]